MASNRPPRAEVALIYLSLLEIGTTDIRIMQNADQSAHCILCLLSKRPPEPGGTHQDHNFSLALFKHWSLYFDCIQRESGFVFSEDCGSGWLFCLLSGFFSRSIFYYLSVEVLSRSRTFAITFFVQWRDSRSPSGSRTWWRLDMEEVGPGLTLPVRYESKELDHAQTGRVRSVSFHGGAAYEIVWAKIE